MNEPQAPKDYVELPDLDPLDEPHPFEPVRNNLKIKVYLYLIALVIIATAYFWNTAEAQEPVPFSEPCPPGASEPCVIYNQALVWIQAGDDRKIAWGQYQNDLDTMVLEFDVEILEFPPKTSQVPVMIATTPETVREFTWQPGRAGSYFARVRTCRTDIPQDGAPIDGEIPEQRQDGSWILCSIWAESIDSTYTDPAVYPRGFIYHATLPPATGGGIE
jgi:hypothetical protein